MDIHKKKQKNVEPGSPNSDIEGDAWLFNFIKRESYLIVAYEIGKQGRETCKRLFDKVFDRVQLPFPDMKIQIFSDGNDDYTSTIPEYYEGTCVDYGQVIKIREGGKIVDKIKKVIYGTPNIEEIETTDIENMNSICRERLGRFVRKTKCFSKKKPRLVNAFICHRLSPPFLPESFSIDMRIERLTLINIHDSFKSSFNSTISKYKS